MRIYFNNLGNLRNFRSFVESIDFSDPSTLEIATHGQRIVAHPANLVLAAALAIKVGKANTHIVNEIPSTGRSLDRLGLYKLTNTPSPFTDGEKEPAGRFVPVSVIRSADDQSRFIADMIPLLHLSEENTTVVKYVIGELVRNVLEHSQTTDGAVVAAQYYPTTNRVSIGICDTGMGLWKSLNTYWSPKTDLEAIHLALTPGITGTTRREGGTSENAGAGLFFIKSIAKIARNYFAIYSGKAEYTLLKHDKRVATPRLFANPRMDPHTETASAPNFDGTLVAVDITLDETPEFKELLSAIGAVYDEAIRERRKMKYREPKFI